MTHEAMRRKRFNAALGYAGMTQAQAAEQFGVTPQHLSFVLNGHFESKRLLAKVDAFADETLAELSRESAA